MENIKRLAMAADHAGYELKEYIKKYLIEEMGYQIKDFGTYSSDSTDYPDYAHPMADSIESGEFELGISVCGSGNGINMTLNKHKGIRSALCWKPVIAKLARQHNDANVCALPGRFISFDEAKEIIDTFLDTTFEGGRHKRRIDKIAKI